MFSIKKYSFLRSIRHFLATISPPLYTRVAQESLRLCELPSAFLKVYFVSNLSSPPGKGRFFVFLCKGLRPLHPRGLNPGGTGLPNVGDARRGRVPCFSGELVPVGCRESGLKKPATPWGYLYGRDCKCRRRFNARGAGGGSPRRNKLIVSPFPPGRGLGGWGQEGKLRAG